MNIDPNKTSSFIDKLVEDKSWYNISMFHYLSEDFIEKNLDKLFLPELIQHQNLNEQFLDNVVLKFALKNKDKPIHIIFNKVSALNLSEPFIVKHFKRLNKEDVSRHQLLSNDFIDKYDKKLKWDCLSCNKNIINLEFIERYKDKLDWVNLFLFLRDKNIIDFDFIDKYIDRLPWMHVTKYFILENKPEAFKRYSNKIVWKMVSEFIKESGNNMLFKGDFINKFKNNIDFNIVSQARWMNQKFIDKYKNKINKNELNYSEIMRKLDVDYILKNKDSILKRLTMPSVAMALSPSQAFQLKDEFKIDMKRYIINNHYSFTLNDCKSIINDVKSVLYLFTEKPYYKELLEFINQHSDLM